MAAVDNVWKEYDEKVLKLVRIFKVDSINAADRHYNSQFLSFMEHKDMAEDCLAEMRKPSQNATTKRKVNECDHIFEMWEQMLVTTEGNLEDDNSEQFTQNFLTHMENSLVAVEQQLVKGLTLKTKLNTLVVSK